MTLRNFKHPFYSSGVNLQKFNNQRLSKLSKESRYNQTLNASDIPGLNIDINTRSKSHFTRTPEKCEKIETEKSPLKFYDIKGNSFKNTLIPKETAYSALRTSEEKIPGLNTDFKLTKVNPKYKGYNRSGAILFHNINQQDVFNVKTPKATDKQRGSRSTLARTKNDFSTLTAER